MAWRGTCLGVVVWLAVGCADSEPDSNIEMDGGVGGVGGAGATSGTGGTGGGDAGAGQCEYRVPAVHACVQGDGITVAGMGETHVELTGTVERAELGFFECIAEDNARVFGTLGKQEQTYTIREGDSELRLTVATGSERALLADGQRVRVTVDDMPSGSMRRDGAVLSVRDDEDGRVLFWFTRTELGPHGLQLPDGFMASDVEPVCRFDGQCGVQYQRDLALLAGDDHIPIAIGDVTTIGGLEALVIVNTEQVQGEDDSCSDSTSYHRVSLALFDRDLITKCDWRDEDRCTEDDDCRDVRAQLVGYSDHRFIACVEDNSCSDGDVGTCAINDHTERLAVFSTTCVPPGWTEAYGACDPDDDAGSP
jgi:hypothetical protein